MPTGKNDRVDSETSRYYLLTGDLMNCLPILPLFKLISIFLYIILQNVLPELSMIPYNQSLFNM